MRGWSERDKEILAEMWQEGIPREEIAERLERSGSAVAVMASRLSLPSRRGKIVNGEGLAPRDCFICHRPFTPSHRFERFCDWCRNSDVYRHGDCAVLHL